MVEPTQKQIEVLRFIDWFSRKHKYPPTYAEIADNFGWTRTSPCNQLTALERKGCVTREFGAYRTLTLTDKGRRLIGGKEPVS